ncbi:hypothetical protein Acy02nite_57220 [Actinoplanes cyaneus]|uniref:non-specific serine/threonine protein kinase n=1 Tax=Actinoplanes cyaneus TaxID=52696 RepID=A0A919INA5_9ACTN|nr:serine/threonine-protein kinase [Actinoplanes cyaneus]MCW2139867.1 serine/threonine protein kinase [Actinoplanes cyaneus]GID67841.1 hypothetical protein Acy02nite_57220 [Actinoplanes cyaneus]
MKRGDLIDGRYRLGERLGQGGMSVVWRADDESLGREVAIKVLSAALAGDPALRQRIRAEARAAAGLLHPGVVAVFDYGELTEAGRVLSYVVMELVEGRSMADMLTGEPLAWELTVLIGAEVAAALAAAHRAGVVHRDVKPGNVMVTATGIKLVDFGISATVGELDGQDGMVLGTPAYLAPERIAGGPVRPATDVYALGLLLYRALAGRMPWQATTVTQMLKAHVYASPAPLPPVDGLPAEVVRLLSRCLAKKPGERPSSAEIAQVLGEISGQPRSTVLRGAAGPSLAVPRLRDRRSRPAVASRIRGRRSRTVPALRLRDRRSRPVLAGAAAATLLALGASWWTMSGGTSPASQPAAAAPPPGTSATSSAPPTTTSTTSTSMQATVVRQVVDHGAAPAAPAAKTARSGPAPKALKLPKVKPPKALKPPKHPKPPKHR